MIIQTVYPVTVHKVLDVDRKHTHTHYVGIGPMKCCIGLIGISKEKERHPNSVLKCKITEVGGDLKPPGLQMIPLILRFELVT